jgi:uncharacterized protein (TIGR00304 family)
MDPATLYGLGMALIFAGIVVILIAALLLLIFNVKGEGKVKGAGAILIGPIPIIFGTDKKSIKAILLLSLALTIALIILIIISYITSG